MQEHACFSHHNSQQGQALLLLVVVMVIGAAAIFYGFSTSSNLDIEKDKKTAAALAQAKAALIGYAVGVNFFSGTPRPGDLPCPDLNDSGSTGASCGNAAGTTGQTSRIGRLPWKSLGLGDLRDGNGERLWYAVSRNFKFNSRSSCATAGAAGCLNSDSRGTITIRDTSGNVIHDGTNPDPFTPSGVIAVIFAPGAALKRQGAAAAQDRSCAGGSCSAAGVCLSSPASNTAKCNPANYLDAVTGVEDNADFLDSSNANGFMHGTIRDAGGEVIVNDRLITITYNDLMPLLERRVAAETLNCLIAYASSGTNVGRYPWASVDVTTFSDAANTLFGRMPDSLTQTVASAPGIMPVAWPSTFPSGCSRTQGTWWMNWKDHVFYGVADAYKPGASAPAGCPTCMSVNPPSATVDKQVVVIVAGKRLAGVAGGQPRSNTTEQQTATNYLEGGNHLHPAFTRQSSSAAFNDTVVYK